MSLKIDSARSNIDKEHVEILQSIFELFILNKTGSEIEGNISVPSHYQILVPDVKLGNSRYIRKDR